MRPLALLALLVAAPAAGCFGYVPAEVGDVGVDDRIRARLEAAESERVRAETGASAEPLRGRVLARRPDTLVVSVLAETPGDAVTGTAGPRLARPIAVPERSIRAVELRVLQRGRTAGLTLGAAALMGFIVYQAFVRTDPAGSRGENPPPVDQAIRPALP